MIPRIHASAEWCHYESYYPDCNGIPVVPNNMFQLSYGCYSKGPSFTEIKQG